MLKTKLDITSIQYLNLFSRITGIKTSNCFVYNNAIIFAVNPALFFKAIGPHGANVRKISERIKRRVKIVILPSRLHDIERFVKSVVYPITFKKITVSADEVDIAAGPQSKASLIGRESRRLLELQQILENFFHIKKLKIS